MILRTKARKYSGNERTVVILDVGTRKMCCLVARLFPRRHRDDTPDLSSRIQVIGYGYQLSRGIVGGRVADMEAAERTVRSVVAKAERAADVTVNEVYVTASFGPLHSQSFTASVDLPAGAVTAPRHGPGDARGQRICLAEQADGAARRALRLHAGL